MQKDNELKLVSKELTVENTTYCGAKCLCCPRDQYSFKWENMDTKFFKSVVDQGVELGMKSWDTCGFGDAFLDQGFEEKLRYVKEKYPFMKVFVSSTCHALVPSKLAWLGELIDTLKISNFGTTKEVYEKSHGGSLKFEKIIQNIEGVFALPKDKRPYIIMLFLVNEHNEDQIEDWKKQWEPLADEIMVWLPHNWAGKNSKIAVDVHGANAVAKSCGRPEKGNLFVRTNGQVSMCCFDFNRNLIIGDLRKQTLKEILAGEELRKLREVHDKGTFSTSNYICKDCDQIYAREDALLYHSNSNRKAGVVTSHPDPDLMNDLLVQSNIPGK